MEINSTKKYKFFDLEFTKLEEAANFFDVSKQMVSNVFSGKKKPSKKMLAKVGIKEVITKIITYEKVDK